ncbi:MAG: Na+/H+ antiporter NhaA [Actinomycetes bacterium]
MATESATVEPVATTWWRRDTSFRRFLSNESGSAAVLLAATVAALVWVNVDESSYDDVWQTVMSIRVGQWSVVMDLRGWINSGLMAFFFFVIGLEARREIDLGEFRDRMRAVAPLLAGIGGMLGAIALYLAFNAGHDSGHGWGVSMSTDTAFALGVLALLGSRAPDRLRGFMVTVTVVDDIVALVVIGAVYADHVSVKPLLLGFGIFLVAVVLSRLHVHYGLVYFALATASWVAVFKSGVDPIVVGLAAGLLAYAAPPERTDLEQATDLFRGFREQPTAELARTARAGVRAALSPNDRYQDIYHPWTSYLVVPLFALANAGVAIDAGFLTHAYTSRITLGIIAGYVVGKPLAVFATTALLTKFSNGRLRPPVGWVSVLGVGNLAGIGFTVSLLIAARAFSGADLEDAKLGVLTVALVSATMGSLVFLITNRFSKERRARLLLGRSDVLVDLSDPVDLARDHVRGPTEAPVTLVEYGDFECPYCGQAEPVVRELLRDFGDVRYVWRHLPLQDVHPHAELAAEGSEAASAQGKFWEMHDLLFDHQGDLTAKDLVRYAGDLDLDVEWFTNDLREHVYRERVFADLDSADVSGARGTPTFFVNGQRHLGAFDLDTLTHAVRAARARAAIAVAQT